MHFWGDEGVDWEQEAKIELDEYTIGSSLQLYPSEFVTMRDLWHAMLMGSANNATTALVRELGFSQEEFVQKMNRKAIELELEMTTFTDPTGLDVSNVSTAYEVARLAEKALRDYPAIAEATQKETYEYAVGGSGRQHTLGNTNYLLTKEHVSVTGGKTGYLYEAGFCLVVQGAGNNQDKIAVALGSPSEWANIHDIVRLLDQE